MMTLLSHAVGEGAAYATMTTPAKQTVCPWVRRWRIAGCRERWGVVDDRRTSVGIREQMFPCTPIRSRMPASRVQCFFCGYPGASGGLGSPGSRQQTRRSGFDLPFTTSPNIMPDTWKATSGHLAALPSPPEHTGTMVNGGWWNRCARPPPR